MNLKHLGAPFKKTMATLLVTALGLFLALQYNETIKSIFESIFPLQGTGIGARVIYTVIITVVVVLAITWIQKLLK